MPYSTTERKVQKKFSEEYGPEEGKRVYWASVNNGRVHGKGIKKPGHHGKTRAEKRRKGKRKQGR